MGASVLAINPQVGLPLYAYGIDASNGPYTQYGLWRWNGTNWSPLGGAFQAAVGVVAMAVGPYDGYIYFAFGGNPAVTLPNGQTASFVCRYDGTQTGTNGWDNMYGGIPYAPHTTDSGVYSIAADGFEIVAGAKARFYETIVYIGGEFSLTLTNDTEVQTNYDIAVFESDSKTNPIVDGTLPGHTLYLPVQKCSGCGGCPWGVSYCDGSGPFIQASYVWGIAPIPNATVAFNTPAVRQAIIGGSFEPVSESCSAGWAGLSEITCTAVAAPGSLTISITNNAWAIPNINRCDSVNTPCDTCYGNPNVGTVSCGGTNLPVFFTGDVPYPIPNSWGSVCNQSPFNLFWEGSSGGTEQWVSPTGFVNQSGETAGISATTQRQFFSGPVYVIGDFFTVDGLSSPYIIQYDP